MPPSYESWCSWEQDRIGWRCLCIPGGYDHTIALEARLVCQEAGYFPPIALPGSHFGWGVGAQASISPWYAIPGLDINPLWAVATWHWKWAISCEAMRASYFSKKPLLHLQTGASLHKHPN